MRAGERETNENSEEEEEIIVLLLLRWEEGMRETDRDSRELPVSNGRRGGGIVSSFESIDREREEWGYLGSREGEERGELRRRRERRAGDSDVNVSWREER